jgi:hypothetical protein
MSVTEIFWNASVESIKRGYINEDSGDTFICLICGKSFERGRVYPDEGLFYEAEKYTQKHITKAHGSVFNFLLETDKKYTGLTDLQKNLLQNFYEGYTDQQIVKMVGGGSPSTIRNHRFTLREREKQAKVFLSIMEILKEKMEERPKFMEVHSTATMVDERYSLTEEENKKVLDSYFKEGPDGPISGFPTKEKRKIVILRHIMKRFESKKHYSEKEVNSILLSVYDDYVTLRRYLIEYGFMDRTPDCSDYWVKS